MCICVSRCLCVWVLVCVCEARVSGGCLDIGVRLVWEDQSGSLPLSSILQGEKEREKARGYFTSHLTEAQRLCVQHCSLKAWQLINGRVDCHHCIPLVTFKMNLYDYLPQITVKKSCDNLYSVADVQRAMNNPLLRNPVLGGVVKGVLQADALDLWTIYLKVYSQINFISQHSYHYQDRKCCIYPRMYVQLCNSPINHYNKTTYKV